MIKAGVIGHPISHSKSPIIHGYWLKQYHIDGDYKTYDISPENLKQGIKDLIDGGLKGFNVTLPHKQSIMHLCHTISDEAQKIGAVNTVVINDDGTLSGFNTDAFGFTQNLDETITNFDWINARVCVIGAGGAARAVMYALVAKRVKHINLTNRTEESAISLAELYGADIYTWDKRHEAVRNSTLVINTTSLGMKGQDSLDIDLSSMADNAVAYDIVYTPLITPFLEQAQNRGIKGVTGIGMLLHQARPAFQKWFGTYPQVSKDLESFVL